MSDQEDRDTVPPLRSSLSLPPSPPNVGLAMSPRKSMPSSRNSLTMSPRKSRQSSRNSLTLSPRDGSKSSTDKSPGAVPPSPPSRVSLKLSPRKRTSPDKKSSNSISSDTDKKRSLSPGSADTSGVPQRLSTLLPPSVMSELELKSEEKKKKKGKVGSLKKMFGKLKDRSRSTSPRPTSPKSTGPAISPHDFKDDSPASPGESPWADFRPSSVLDSISSVESIHAESLTLPEEHARGRSAVFSDQFNDQAMINSLGLQSKPSSPEPQMSTSGMTVMSWPSDLGPTPNMTPHVSTQFGIRSPPNQMSVGGMTVMSWPSDLGPTPHASKLLKTKTKPKKKNSTLRANASDSSDLDSDTSLVFEKPRPSTHVAAYGSGDSRYEGDKIVGKKRNSYKVAKARHLFPEYVHGFKKPFKPDRLWSNRSHKSQLSAASSNRSMMDFPSPVMSEDEVDGITLHRLISDLPPPESVMIADAEVRLFGEDRHKPSGRSLGPSSSITSPRGTAAHFSPRFATSERSITSQRPTATSPRQTVDMRSAASARVPSGSPEHKERTKSTSNSPKPVSRKFTGIDSTPDSPSSVKLIAEKFDDRKSAISDSPKRVSPKSLKSKSSGSSSTHIFRLQHTQLELTFAQEEIEYLQDKMALMRYFQAWRYEVGMEKQNAQDSSQASGDTEPKDRTEIGTNTDPSPAVEMTIGTTERETNEIGVGTEQQEVTETGMGTDMVQREETREVGVVTEEQEIVEVGMNTEPDSELNAVGTNTDDVELNETGVNTAHSDIVATSAREIFSDFTMQAGTDQPSSGSGDRPSWRNLLGKHIDAGNNRTILTNYFRRWAEYVKWSKRKPRGIEGDPSVGVQVMAVNRERRRLLRICFCSWAVYCGADEDLKASWSNDLTMALLLRSQPGGVPPLERQAEMHLYKRQAEELENQLQQLREVRGKTPAGALEIMLGRLQRVFEKQGREMIRVQEGIKQGHIALKNKQDQFQAFQNQQRLAIDRAREMALNSQSKFCTDSLLVNAFQRWRVFGHLAKVQRFMNRQKARDHFIVDRLEMFYVQVDRLRVRNLQMRAFRAWRDDVWRKETLVQAFRARELDFKRIKFSMALAFMAWRRETVGRGSLRERQRLIGGARHKVVFAILRMTFSAWKRYTFRLGPDAGIRWADDVNRTPERRPIVPLSPARRQVEEALNQRDMMWRAEQADERAASFRGYGGPGGPEIGPRMVATMPGRSGSMLSNTGSVLSRGRSPAHLEPPGMRRHVSPLPEDTRPDEDIAPPPPWTPKKEPTDDPQQPAQFGDSKYMPGGFRKGVHGEASIGGVMNMDLTSANVAVVGKVEKDGADEPQQLSEVARVRADLMAKGQAIARMKAEQGDYSRAEAPQTPPISALRAAASTPPPNVNVSSADRLGVAPRIISAHSDDSDDDDLHGSRFNMSSDSSSSGSENDSKASSSKELKPPDAVAAANARRGSTFAQRGSDDEGPDDRRLRPSRRDMSTTLRQASKKSGDHSDDDNFLPMPAPGTSRHFARTGSMAAAAEQAMKSMDHHHTPRINRGPSQLSQNSDFSPRLQEKMISGKQLTDSLLAKQRAARESRAEIGRATTRSLREIAREMSPEHDVSPGRQRSRSDGQSRTERSASPSLALPDPEAQTLTSVVVTDTPWDSMEEPFGLYGITVVVAEGAPEILSGKHLGWHVTEVNGQAIDELEDVEKAWNDESSIVWVRVRRSTTRGLGRALRQWGKSTYQQTKVLTKKAADKTVEVSKRTASKLSESGDAKLESATEKVIDDPGAFERARSASRSGSEAGSRRVSLSASRSPASHPPASSSYAPPTVSGVGSASADQRSSLTYEKEKVAAENKKSADDIKKQQKEAKKLEKQIEKDMKKQAKYDKYDKSGSKKGSRRSSVASASGVSSKSGNVDMGAKGSALIPDDSIYKNALAYTNMAHNNRQNKSSEGTGTEWQNPEEYAVPVERGASRLDSASSGEGSTKVKKKRRGSGLYGSIASKFSQKSKKGKKKDGSGAYEKHGYEQHDSDDDYAPAT